ncbi:HAD hydrolase-like protein [Candidatus Woesearchaeota archaeon]|nr:HAD hydrolase-like protein [Candidatus Woesearchaeota archaeon]
MTDEVRIVAYDLDETLVKLKFECIEKILNKTHKSLGIRLPNELEKKMIWYSPKREGILSNNFHAEINNYFNTLYKYYTVKNIKNYVSVFPDVASLKKIKNLGRKIGILTSTHPEIADYEINLVKKFLGNNIIDETVIIQEHDIKNKPHSDGLVLLLEKLGMDIENERAFLVGDTDLDILTANNAVKLHDINVESVLVDRKHNQEGIIELRPGYRLKTLDQVECYI